jgi:lysophospholipase L1-like esterase
MRVILINLLILMGFLVVLELVFGTWFSDVHALHQFTKPRDLVIERANPVSDTLAVITYTRDANGFRGLDGEVSDIDVLTVGGSTTDQRFLDDSQTWQAALRGRFAEAGHPVSVANAGIDGQTTYGHIENFSSWFNLIDGLNARYVLFYVGINDALILAENRAFDTLEATSPRLKLQLFIREKSALYQLYLIAKRTWLTPEISHSFEKVNFATQPPFATSPKLSQEVLQSAETRSALAALTGRVEELARLSREMGAEPIFVTQRSTAWTRDSGQILGVENIDPGFHSTLVARFGPLNGIDIYRIERGVADAVLAGCQGAGATCFDLMRDLEFDLDQDFYDELHTTASGSEKIAGYLFDRLNGLEGFRP